VPLKRDRSFLDAALRETHEEVGISPEQIQFLGELAPPENSLGGMRVWPFVVSLNYHLPHAFSQKKMTGIYSRRRTRPVKSTLLPSSLHLPLVSTNLSTGSRKHISPPIGGTCMPSSPSLEDVSGRATVLDYRCVRHRVGWPCCHCGHRGNKIQTGLGVIY
jgi:hypothetical protein